MTIKVTMPQMGESVVEGTLTKWLKKAGDTVARDEPLFEISTDKVDSEIPSPASGILSEILMAEGAVVQINTVLAIIREPGEAEEASAAGEIQAAEAPAGIAAEAAPILAEREKPEAESSLDMEEVEQEETAPTVRVQEVRTSPLVRKLARENKIPLAALQGTGVNGRITKEDVIRHLAHRPAPDADKARSHETAAATQLPAPAAGAGVLNLLPEAAKPIAAAPSGMIPEADIVPMTAMRKAIAEHMVSSKRISAHVNTVFEVDVSPIVQLREQRKADFQKAEGFGLTFTPFFARALVDNVREFPVFNASVSGESIVYKKSVNLGVAVALEGGLFVPVVRAAHLKSFAELARAIHDLAERARTKRLKPDEVQNGTITITNPGSYGALFANPIINQPQVAILGVGGIEKRPVVIQDAIAIRSMVCLSLSFDHRVIDGSVADQFMASLKKRLQEWNQWID